MKKLLEKIFYHAIEDHASDIHIELNEKLIIRFRIYGKIIHYRDYNQEDGLKIINYIKYKSHLNTNNKLLCSTGEFRSTINNKEYNFRVSLLPTKNIQSLVIRIMYDTLVYSLDELSPQRELIRFLKNIIFKRSGLFIISGVTGSGKSTTLYTLINELNKNHDLNIISLEDPIEMNIDKCLQIELNEDIGITYTTCLKQILRHDPDVIVIGEIRDEITAKIAIRCALTGHLVYATIHSSDAILTIQRLLNLNVDNFELKSVLIGVLSQKMIYDYQNKKSFVIGEFCNVSDIYSYIEHNVLTFKRFDTIIKDFIYMGYDESLFKYI